MSQHLQTTVYKAQWPLATTEQPMIVIYPANGGGIGKGDYYLPATPQHRKHLFKNRYVKVFFRGTIEGSKVRVEEFVRKGDWL